MSEFTSKIDAACPTVVVFEAGGKALKVRIVVDNNPDNPNMTFTVLNQDESLRYNDAVTENPDIGTAVVRIRSVTKPEMAFVSDRPILYLRGHDRSFDFASTEVYKPDIHRFTPDIITKICMAVCELNDKTEGEIEQAKERARIKAEFCREVENRAAGLPQYPENPHRYHGTFNTIWTRAEAIFGEYYEALAKAKERQTKETYDSLRTELSELTKKLQITEGNLDRVAGHNTELVLRLKKIQDGFAAISKATI
jgi:hypothetical protein